jgi:hypothetical protein
MGASDLQPAEKAEFLRCYVEQKFNVAAAARAIDRHWTTIYRHLRTDPEFRRAFEEARQLAGDMAYAEAIRRAIYGVQKPVFGSLGNNSGTGIVGEITEYSDTLLVKILQALRPEFRERAHVDLTTGGDRIAMNDNQIAAKLAAIIASARHRQLSGEVVDAEYEALPAPDEFEDLL